MPRRKKTSRTRAGGGGRPRTVTPRASAGSAANAAPPSGAEPASVPGYTPERLREIEAAWRTVELKKRDPLAYYAPHEGRYTGNGGQRRIHESRGRWRLIRGSNRCGKTECGAAELGAWMLGFRPWGWKAMLEAAGREWPGTWEIEPYDLPDNLEVYGPVRRFDGDVVLPPIKALAIGRTQQTVGSVIWPKIQKLLGPYIKKTYGMRDGVPTSFLIGESLCELRSYEQEWRKFEGNEWDLAWFDEAPPESIWFSVRRGLTDRGGSGIFTMTPDIEQGWVYDLFEISPPPDTETVAMSIWDNARSNGGYIDDKEISAWVSAIPAHERVYRVDGEWPHLVGRIYKSWDSGKHVIEPPEIPANWPWFCAIDPHDRLPWAIIWAVLTERHEIVVMHEWPDSFWHHETKAMLRPTAEYAEMILDMESRMNIRGPLTRIVDPRYARTPAMVTGTCIEDDLFDAGVHVTGDVGKDFDRSNSVAEGHHKVAQWLEADHLLVSRDCGFGNVAYAFDHYSWDESTEKHQARHGPKELPGRKYKHYMDCVRMLVEYLHGTDLDVLFKKQERGVQRVPVGVTGYGV